MLRSAERTSAGIPALLSGIGLLLGRLIYLGIRPAEPRFFDWLRSSGLDGVVHPLRRHFPATVTHLPEWMVHSLPNALWSFACAVLITAIWPTCRHRIRYFWLATIPVLVLGFELLQYRGILPGNRISRSIPIRHLRTSASGSGPIRMPPSNWSSSIPAAEPFTGATSALCLGAAMKSRWIFQACHPEKGKEEPFPSGTGK